MTDVSKFFTALSERAYKENDLSDVTYAMCEADLSFRQFFLDFFFPGRLNASEVTIQREHSTDWGRPDFWIRTKDNKLYIVEVKIWDGSHHFEQYFDILKGEKELDNLQDGDMIGVWSRLGYIANYKIKYEVQEAYKVYDKRDAKDLCAVRTWEEFSEELKKYQSLNSQLVEAYAAYLARVCPYDDFAVKADESLDVQSFTNIADFYKTISDIVVKLDGVVPYNRSPRQFQSMRRMGRYFEYKKFKNLENAESSVWGWLGVVYEKFGDFWEARVCVEFEDTPGWGEKVCDRYKDMVKNGILRFYYKGDLDKNKDNLRIFVRDVLAGEVQPKNAQCSTKFDALLAMKTLPFAIEKYFYGKLNNDWMIERGYDSDEENPNSHCGRYFKLRRISKSGDTSSGKDDIPQGWVGVVFDEQRHFNGKPGGKPVFIVQLPKCDGVFNLENKGWTQDQCSQYWWNMKLNSNSGSATVEKFAGVFWDCLSKALSKEDQK